MARQMAWGANKPGVEDSFLIVASAKEEYYGHLLKRRELTQRAIESAQRNNKKETAANYESMLPGRKRIVAISFGPARTRKPHWLERRALMSKLQQL